MAYFDAASSALLTSCALLELLLAGTASCQLLQGHDQHEVEMRPCNSTSSVTENCVAPNHPMLVTTVVFFSLLLLAMICSMALPYPVQNRLLGMLCACRRKRVFSYVDIGLYKTRHSMYRKEVYVRHVWGNRNKRGSSAVAKRLSVVAGRLENGGPPPSQSRPVVVDKLAGAAGCQAAAAAEDSQRCLTLGSFADMPLMTCGSAFCFRSDPNICVSTYPSLTVTPASPAACVTFDEASGGGL